MSFLRDGRLQWLYRPSASKAQCSTICLIGKHDELILDVRFPLVQRSEQSKTILIDPTSRNGFKSGTIPTRITTAIP